MASRTRSSSGSRKRSSKAQFFVLSAFVMIAIMFVMSQFIQPSGIFDTSSVVFMDEVFVFNNVKEKAEQVVQVSESCADLAFNLAEYEQFVEDFARQRNANLAFDFAVVQPCDDDVRMTNFYLSLVSTRASAESTFTAQAS